MRTHNTPLTAWLSLFFNIIFCIGYISVGTVTDSWWLLTVGVYYAVLSVTRFIVLHLKDETPFISKFVGVMLILLSIPLSGTVILGFVKDRGTIFHEIVMIAIAAYSFSKITIAIVKLIQSRKSKSAKLISLRNISLTTAFVSIFSLQRSMLVSFGDMPAKTIRIMNLATGISVCIIIFLLGLNLIQNNINKVKRDELN